MAVYALALGAALLFGLGSVVQQRVAFDAPPGKTLKLSLLFWLVQQPLWLVGVGTALVGNLLSGAALGLGSVALVQPLLVSRLLFALPLSAAWMRQRLSGLDWAGALATAGGLAVFLAVGRPQPGPESDVPLWRWAVTFAAIAVVIALLVAVARRLHAARQAAVLGAGAGMLFGLQSGLTHTAVRGFIEGGLPGLLLNWTTYAVAVTAVVGTLLAQSAYEMAPLQASYPSLAAVEPLAGIGIGVGVVGGTLQTGTVAVLAQALALAVMTYGIYLLARSPLVTGHREIMQRREDEETVYRIEDAITRRVHELDEMLTSIETAPSRAVTEQTARELRGRLGELDEDLDELSSLSTQMHGRRVERTKAAGRREDRLTKHERAMDRWQQELDGRETSLRATAQRLHARVDALAVEP